MESLMALPLTPSVSTMTVLFSLTSRWLRPLQRTTTLMLVSSKPPMSSDSKSRSLRFVPVVDTDSAGDTARDPRPARWTGACRELVAVDGLVGRPICERLPAPDRMLELMVDRLSSRSERVCRR
jgi:hypothetical protein